MDISTEHFHMSRSIHSVLDKLKQHRMCLIQAIVFALLWLAFSLGLIVVVNHPPTSSSIENIQMVAFNPNIMASSIAQDDA